MIASNAGGAAEIINKYGGILVEPGDPPALAETLLKVYKKYRHGDLWEPAIDHEKLLKDFNSELQAEKVLDIYKKILQKQ